MKSRILKKNTKKYILAKIWKGGLFEDLAVEGRAIALQIWCKVRWGVWDLRCSWR